MSLHAIYISGNGFSLAYIKQFPNQTHPTKHTQKELRS